MANSSGVTVAVLSNRLPTLSAEITAKVAAIVRETAEEIATDAKQSIENSPRSGRTYRRGGATQKASAPGEPPASQTGVLMGGIKAQMTGATSAVVSTSPQSPYARALEFGTHKMAARPFMRPASEKARGTFKVRVADAIKGA